MRTESTVVRRLRSSDLEQFATYRSDAGVASLQGWSPMGHTEARQFLAQAENAERLCAGGWVQLAIALARSDRLIGDVGVFLTDDWSEAEVGFTVSREAQGQGHGRRAAGLITELVFRDTPATQIRAVTDVRNLACMRMLENAGFRKGHEQDAVFKGEPCRECVFIMGRTGASPQAEVDHRPRD